MTNLLILIIALIWLIGACLRVYRQARFYQIEEYMSGRYLRWLLADRSRWLPTRPALAGVIGAALSVVLSEGGATPPGVIAIIAALIAVYPPDEGEIKKPFRATARAKRLLGASFAALIVVGVIGFWFVSRVRLRRHPPAFVERVRAGAVPDRAAGAGGRQPA